MDFHFQAKQAGGGQVSSRISARDNAEARSTLESRGFRDIELTRIDPISEGGRGASSSPSVFNGCYMAIMALMGVCIVIICGWLGLMAWENPELVKFADREEETSVQREQNSSDSTATDPYPQVIRESNAALFRLTLENYVNITESITTTRRESANREHVQWVDLISVSVREGTEIGYDYDVQVTFQSRSGMKIDGQLDTSLRYYSSRRVVLLLHVSEDYRVANNALWKGEPGRDWDMVYIADVIEQLGR